MHRWWENSAVQCKITASKLCSFLLDIHVEEHLGISKLGENTGFQEVCSVKKLSPEGNHEEWGMKARWRKEAHLLELGYGVLQRPWVSSSQVGLYGWLRKRERVPDEPRSNLKSRGQRKGKGLALTSTCHSQSLGLHFTTTSNLLQLRVRWWYATLGTEKVKPRQMNCACSHKW